MVQAAIAVRQHGERRVVAHEPTASCRSSTIGCRISSRSSSVSADGELAAAQLLAANMRPARGASVLTMWSISAMRCVQSPKGLPRGEQVLQLVVG